MKQKKTISAKVIVSELKKHANPENVRGMARFGIRGKHVIGGPGVPALRKMAKTIGKDHELALKLWDSGFHEARLLAGMIDDPAKVTKKQMDAWAKDFDSWDVCDLACINLFRLTKHAYSKACDWSGRKEEYVKRAGFALIATLAIHDSGAPDVVFARLLALVKREAADERNYVRKAVNWALRQIGKRNLRLRREAIRAARQIQKIDSKAARWVAADALRELTKQT